MSNPGSTPAAQASLSSGASLLWARAASFLAVFPLAFWIAVHLWNNLAAFHGAEAWQRAVTEYPNPFAELCSMAVVLLPLVIHTIWGFQRLRGTRLNVARYPTYGNIKYVLQRVAALGVLAFLVAHLWKAWLDPRINTGHPEQFTELARTMHWHLPTLLVYLLGTLGVAYHLANGLSGFAWTFGVASGRTATARIDKLAIAVFLVLLVMAWGAIYALYAAGAGSPPLVG